MILRLPRPLQCAALVMLMYSEWAIGQPATPGTTAQGAAESAPVAASLEAPEIGGVITNETLTSLGYLFHSKFAEFWSQQDDADSYALAVKEKISQRAGTEVQVFFGEYMVFRGNMPRSVATVTDMALLAAEKTHERVVELGIQTLLFNDPDMAGSGY